MKSILLAVNLTLLSLQLAHSQSDGDYRSFQDGPWNDANTWQVFNNGDWQNLGASEAGIYQNVIPSSSSGAISILTHQISIPGGIYQSNVFL